MLARLFGEQKTGFYVDVGAADPINLSVTKWFYDRGWSGLNIEPNRQLFERLAADRPRDINLDCGVGAIASEIEFLEFEVGELSSFDTRVHRAPENEAQTREARMVKVLPLTDLLAQHCEGRVIDFLKVDVEGWELEVFKGLDLQRFRPTVILAEATVPQSREESHGDWEPLLLAADYTFVYFDGVNRFYLANERAYLKSHFSIPPNTFDDFEIFPLVRARIDAEARLKAMQALEGEYIRTRADADARLEAMNILERDLIQARADAVSHANSCRETISRMERHWAWRLTHVSWFNSRSKR
ncbi:MAG: FkbM family methyltransferase [Hyphomicrobiales bacterium]|nr:FkbM family methyltransferase [Hyphomicrobiales bacterium]